MKSYKAKFKVYLDDLAKRKPSPGGGSAVCLSFCLGLSLIEKAINYSHPTNYKKAIATLSSLRKKIYPYIDKDAQIFAKIMASSGAKRSSLIRQSENMIIELAKASKLAFSLAKALESGIKKGIISDFYIGLRLIKVALFGCISNLEANSKMFGKKNKQIGEFRKVLRKWQRY